MATFVTHAWACDEEVEGILSEVFFGPFNSEEDARAVLPLAVERLRASLADDGFEEEVVLSWIDQGDAEVIEVEGIPH